MRRHFCEFAARGLARFSAPRKICLNCTMPALVNSNVGSPAGTSEALGSNAQRAEASFLPSLDELGGELVVVNITKGAKPPKHPVDERRRGSAGGEQGRDLRFAARAPSERTESRVHRPLVVERGAGGS